MTAPERRVDLQTRVTVDAALQRREAQLERAIVRRRTRIEVTRLAVLLLLVLSVWVFAYQGRADLASSTRAGCDRAILDRRANAAGWRTAHLARTNTARDPSTPPAERASALAAAATYARVAAGLDKRARVDCAKAFPSPKILPF